MPANSLSIPVELWNSLTLLSYSRVVVVLPSCDGNTPPYPYWVCDHSSDCRLGFVEAWSSSSASSVTDFSLLEAASSSLPTPHERTQSHWELLKPSAIHCHWDRCNHSIISLSSFNQPRARQSCTASSKVFPHTHTSCGVQNTIFHSHRTWHQA